MVCAHNLAYDEKPDYQMLKKILNPSGIPLGPLEFCTKGDSLNTHAPDNQKVSNSSCNPMMTFSEAYLPNEVILGVRMSLTVLFLTYNF